MPGNSRALSATLSMQIPSDLVVSLLLKESYISTKIYLYRKWHLWPSPPVAVTCDLPMPLRHTAMSSWFRVCPISDLARREKSWLRASVRCFCKRTVARRPARGTRYTTHVRCSSLCKQSAASCCPNGTMRVEFYCARTSSCVTMHRCAQLRKTIILLATPFSLLRWKFTSMSFLFNRSIL